MGENGTGSGPQPARRLVLAAARELEFETTELEPLALGEIRLKTVLSGVSAGTELAQYRGTSPFLHRRWDAGQRLFLEEPGESFPIRHLGYGEVGEVTAIADDVNDVAIGDRVFGTWGHVDWHQMPASEAAERLLPGGADPRIGIFAHIGAVGLNGAHDAGIRAGDTVAVFGLGVPGQIAAQSARLSGASVIAIDPVAERRELALRLGATRAIDPAEGSPAERLKRETGGKGVDAAIEASGAIAALSEAIRAVAYASRVVALGFYQGEAAGLRLGEEFHLNRIELVSSQISGVAPAASHRWSRMRLWQSIVRMQAEGRLSLLPLITDVVPFEKAPELFQRLDGGDPAVLQSVLSFDAPADR